MVEPAVAIDALNNKVVSRELLDGNYPISAALTLYPISCRADVVTSVSVYTIVDGSLKMRSVMRNVVDTLGEVAVFAPFNYAPMLFTEDDIWQRIVSLSELTNYCHISSKQIITLNEACMFTLLNMQPSDKFIAKK